MSQSKGVLQLDKIRISNMERTDTVVMPRVKTITVGAKEESKRTVMVSGKVVKDVLGHRTTIAAAWDWIPADTVAALSSLLRKNSFLWVEYPSPEGFAAGSFEVSYPSMNVFSYKNGEAVWHDVKLDMTAQEVT